MIVITNKHRLSERMQVSLHATSLVTPNLGRFCANGIHQHLPTPSNNTFFASFSLLYNDFIKNMKKKFSKNLECKNLFLIFAPYS